MEFGCVCFNDYKTKPRFMSAMEKSIGSMLHCSYYPCYNVVLNYLAIFYFLAKKIPFKSEIINFIMDWGYDKVNKIIFHFLLFNYFS